MTIVPQCYKCAHFLGASTCLAFPKKIPDVILMGINDHSKPFKGDEGIQFENIVIEKKENE